MWVYGPGYSQGAGNNPAHTEAEEHSGHNELLATALIRLKDSHIGYAAKDVEDEEHGLDGDVDTFGWSTAQ